MKQDKEDTTTVGGGNGHIEYLEIIHCRGLRGSMERWREERRKGEKERTLMMLSLVTLATTWSN